MLRLTKLNFIVTALAQTRSYNKQNHYEVLKVHPDSTTEQIKEAFITLSKKFHPDVKGVKSDAKHTEQFVKISEAYQVLSKKSTREVYDQYINGKAMYGNSYSGGPTTEYHRPWSSGTNSSDHPKNYQNYNYYGVKGLAKVSNVRIMTFLFFYGVVGAIIGFFSIKPWSSNPRSSEPPQDYYGVKGLKKISNLKIMAFLLIFGLAGGIIGFFSIKKSFTVHRSQLDEVSAIASAHHASVRAEAEQFGNEQQIKRLVHKLAASSNS